MSKININFYGNNEKISSKSKILDACLGNTGVQMLVRKKLATIPEKGVPLKVLDDDTSNGYIHLCVTDTVFQIGSALIAVEFTIEADEKTEKFFKGDSVKMTEWVFRYLLSMIWRDEIYKEKIDAYLLAVLARLDADSHWCPGAARGHRQWRVTGP